MNEYQKLIAAYSLAYEALVEKGKDLFTQQAKEFMEKYPEVHSIMWRQYAPSFNDGDPCYFSVHEAEMHVDPSKVPDDILKLSGLTKDDEPCNDYEYGWGSNSYSYVLNKVKEKRELSQREKDLLKDYDVLMSCPDTFFESFFGDGAEVTITKDGINVDDYYDGC